MGIFLTSALFSVLVFLSLRQIFKNLYSLEDVGEKEKWAPFVTMSSAFFILVDFWAGTGRQQTASLYLSMSIASLYSLNSSLIPFSWSKAVSSVSISLQFIASAAFVICRNHYEYEVPGYAISCITTVIFLALALLYLAGIAYRLSDNLYVMRCGSVWSVVCLAVDSAYIVVLMMLAVLMPLLSAWLSSLISLLILSALCVRIRNSSAFVLLVNMERRIVESMKVSHVDFPGESPGIDQLYNNIYERVLRYFEAHRPYLNSELTINDIVEVVYTNKLYISKAISHCTGRNFCQFVNYYRVTYAVEIFRENPQLKVVELSNRSGFNSTTSFSAAFRLYMGENPGDWCRKERVRLIKK